MIKNSVLWECTENTKGMDLSMKTMKYAPEYAGEMTDGTSALYISADTLSAHRDGELFMQRGTFQNKPQTAEKSHRLYKFFKRAQDIFFSSLALAVLCVPMAAVAAAIWIDSPGASPLFCQTRVGKNGKEFKFWKFRSMIPNAESKLEELLDKNEMDGPVFKIKEDPRITKVGKFIRKTSIDELPQLWNILKGDMSIVGPRPALPREVAQYDEKAKKRLSVRPGLSCYWQIQPHRNNLSFDDWMELDLKYINERSFAVDWKIIFGTIGAVLGMQGE